MPSLGEVSQFIFALLSAFAAWQAWQAKRVSASNATDIGKVQANVTLIERNTNSISTRNEAIAKALGVHEGIATGRAQGAAEAAMLAEGQRQGVESERSSVAAANPVEPVSPAKKI